MEKTTKKGKNKKREDRKTNTCCWYVADPCGCYTVDPCGCYYVDPCGC